MAYNSNNINYKIVKEYGAISTTAKNWSKELNLISWNNYNEKYDLREWGPNHSVVGKGITLTDTELEKLYELLKDELD